VSELRAACFGRDPEREGWPSVSVVVPVRNEQEHLERSVASVLSQEYPVAFDLCLAVAPSDDDTAAIAAAIARDEPRVSVVANEAGATPAGLNAAIHATTGSIVVRVDGHAELSDRYIRRAVETMMRTGAVNVGGMQVPAPATPFESAVATATTSWMGTGGASYRVGGTEGPVDTVYLGVFDRAAGDAVGWYDESLIRNQDYELNIRLRQADGTVWFDPELRVSYRPRATTGELASQYYQYGSWKAEVARLHPDSLKMRQVIPAAAPLVLAASLVLIRVRRSAIVVPLAYLTAVATSAATTPGGLAQRLRVAVVLPVMQLAWGVGFIGRALTNLRRSVDGRAG